MKTTGLNLLKVSNVLKIVTSGSLASLLLVSCGPQFGLKGIHSDSDRTASGMKASKYDLNLHTMNKTVCDPFGGGTSQSPIHGLQASLFYSGAGSPRLSSSQDYVDKATKSTQALFFSDLNVPTRMFSEGFATQSSAVVKDDMGSKLIEYFGLKFETVLRLNSDQAEGDYELAVLADDGAVVKAQINGQWRTIVNNDGDHSTKMGCGLSVLNLSKDSAIPLEITYYQGPRFHIANVLMWRKSAASGQDPQCGKAGNEYFFDPAHASAPLQPYKDLLARGWEPISSNNFFVPNTSGYNPCVEGTNPVISSLVVSEILTNDVYLTWNTDIPAGSQVLLTHTTTGAQVMTDSDNLLGTSHRVHIGGLEAGATYKAQAVSISADLGKAISNELTFTTLN
jgi:hypothetical protein